jgi:hypothetical protein
MKKILALLLVTIALQLNCGTIAAKKLETNQLVGDFPTIIKKDIYNA